MHKFIMVLSVLITANVTLIAQNNKAAEPVNLVVMPSSYFNPEFLYFSDKENKTPISAFTFTTPLTKSIPWLLVGGEVYAQRDASWAEALIGPAVIFKGLEVGFMAGYENELGNTRIAPWVLYNSPNSKFYCNFYYETQIQGVDSSKRGEMYEQVTRSTEKNKLKFCIGVRLFEKNIGPEFVLRKNKMYFVASPLYGWTSKETGYLLGIGAEFD